MADIPDNIEINFTAIYLKKSSLLEVLKKTALKLSEHYDCNIKIEVNVCKLIQEVKHVHVDKSLSEYILQLTTATRHHKKLYVGASPRASLHVFRFSQAFAFMEGRDYCTPDDIQKSLCKCLPHRLLLKDQIPHAGISSTIC